MSTTVQQPVVERTVAASRAPAGEPARVPVTPAQLRFPGAQVLLIATLMAATLAFGAVEAWASAGLAVLTLVVLMLWTMASIQQGFIRVVWSPLYLPAALFMILGGVQYFAQLTSDRNATHEGLLNLAVALIVFVVTGQLFHQSSTTVMRRLGLAVAIFTSALSLLAILQSLSRTSLIYWSVKSPGETFGPYVNRNHYAGLMEMLIPLTASYAFSRATSYVSRWIRAAAVLLPVASVLLSGSRGGLIALGAETAVAAAVFLVLPPNVAGWSSARRSRRDAMAWVGAVAVAAVALFLWINPNGFSTRLWTVASTKPYHEMTATDRVAVARDSVRMIKDHPWLGVGLGGFETVYPQYQSVPSNLTWDHAHNDYLEAVSETGLVGAALILSALAMFFRLALRSLRVHQGREPAWIGLGAMLGCCGLLVHSLVDFNLHVPANAAWFAFCAALATLPDLRQLRERRVTG